MKLTPENITLVSAEEYAMRYSNGGWDYGLKKVAENIKFPKSLLTAALKELNEWCESRFVDASKFCFLEIIFNDPTWQIDFSTDKSGDYKISMYEIYMGKRDILQRCIEMK